VVVVVVVVVVVAVAVAVAVASIVDIVVAVVVPFLLLPFLWDPQNQESHFDLAAKADLTIGIGPNHWHRPKSYIHKLILFGHSGIVEDERLHKLAQRTIITGMAG